MKQKMCEMSYATCEICDTHVEEYIIRTPGNAEMKCPSCNMWVYGFYTKPENVKDTIKRDAKNKYNERISVIIKNKVDYYNKKK
jgi:hypothetical protein